MRKRIIDSGLLPVFTSKLTTGNGQPIAVTGPISTADLYSFRASRFLDSSTGNVELRIYYETSDDGVNWSGTRTAVGTFSSVAPWEYNQGTASAVDTDVRNFVRFGFQGRNTSGSALERAMARLVLEVDETSGQTLVAPPQMVWCNGTSTAIFHPLRGLGPVPIEAFNGHRATLQVESIGDANVQPAYQVSNDGVNWYSGAASAAAGNLRDLQHGAGVERHLLRRFVHYVRAIRAEAAGPLGRRCQAQRGKRVHTGRIAHPRPPHRPPEGVT